MVQLWSFFYRYVVSIYIIDFLPVRKISRFSVEVPSVDNDVSVGRSVPLDPLNGLDGLKS